MEETCIICEKGRAVETTQDRAVNFGGKQILIKNSRYMQCFNCDGAYFTGQQATEEDKKLKAALAEKTS